MRKFKKEQYYVNSLNTTLPENSPELPKSKQPQGLKYGLESFQDLEKSIYRERLKYFKGSVTDAAKSLKINRNTYISVLGLSEIQKIRQSFEQENKTSFSAVYNEYGGKIRIIANKLKISKQQVANLAVKYGLRVRKNRDKKTERQLSLFR